MLSTNALLTIVVTICRLLWRHCCRFCCRSLTYITECATNHRLRFSPGSEFNGTMEIRAPRGPCWLCSGPAVHVFVPWWYVNGIHDKSQKTTHAQCQPICTLVLILQTLRATKNAKCICVKKNWRSFIRQMSSWSSDETDRTVRGVYSI